MAAFEKAVYNFSGDDAIPASDDEDDAPSFRF